MPASKKAHAGGPLFIIIGLLYIGLLILFAWQTYLFVDWLFPADQIMMKILLVSCFDGMSLVWSLADLFYHFAIKAARTIVRFGWGVSFFLSLLATVFYLVISSMFRFHIDLTVTQVNLGYGITAAAVVFQVVMMTFFLYVEWNVRHPYQDDYLETFQALTADEKRDIEKWIQEQGFKLGKYEKAEPIALAQTSEVKKKRLPRRRVVTEELASQAESTTPGA